MSDWFTASPESLVAIALTAVAVYAAILIYTQVAGLRSFAKMSGFDFAMTVAIGSMVASSVLTKTPSLLQALVAIGVVYALQIVVGEARQRWGWAQRAVDNEPLLLMDGPTFLRDNMRQARVTEGDLWSKLREANVLDVAHVRAVVLETTGDVSVLHGEPDGTPLQPRILTGVRGADAMTGRDIDLRPVTDAVE
ncbi:DUF421 domain-containing protein [Rubrivirga sp. IMCC43871]|uniref:DUF421 domain-containing protein n=1 Tax=Rubrivirga sp. IMCC43871 TaxID=3391575 RepID=UPI00398FB437